MLKVKVPASNAMEYYPQGPGYTAGRLQAVPAMNPADDKYEASVFASRFSKLNFNVPTDHKVVASQLYTLRAVRLGKAY